MRALSLLAGLLCVTVVAAAQDVPRAEIFAGYSYGNFNVLTNRSSLNGWNATATINIYHWFGLTTDFGGLYGGSGSVTFAGGVSETQKEKLHMFSFGPQVTYRRGRVTAFAHLLVGEALVSESIQNTGCVTVCPVSFTGRSSYGAAVPGGGWITALERTWRGACRRIICPLARLTMSAFPPAWYFGPESSRARPRSSVHGRKVKIPTFAAKNAAKMGHPLFSCHWPFAGRSARATIHFPSSVMSPTPTWARSSYLPSPRYFRVLPSQPLVSP